MDSFYYSNVDVVSGLSCTCASFDNKAKGKVDFFFFFLMMRLPLWMPSPRDPESSDMNIIVDHQFNHICGSYNDWIDFLKQVDKLLCSESFFYRTRFLYRMCMLVIFLQNCILCK